MNNVLVDLEGFFWNQLQTEDAKFNQKKLSMFDGI